MDSTTPTRGTPGPRGGRLLEADLARGAAMVGVLVLHAGAWMGRDGAAAAAVYPAVDRLARFCVPAFVLLTGYVMAWAAGAGPLHRARFARGRALRILVPFGAWMTISVVAGVLLGSARPGSLADVARLVWDGTIGGYLYFLVVAAQLSLLFAVLPRGRRAALVACAVAVPLQLGLTGLRASGWAPAGPLAPAWGAQAQWFAPWWIGCYAAGCAAAWYRELLLRAAARWRGPCLLLGAGVAALALLDVTRAGATGYDAFFRPSTFALTLAVAAAVAALAGALPPSGRAPALLEAAARRSLGVYLVHPLVLLGLGRLLQGVFPLALDGPLWLTLPALATLVAAVLGGSLLAVEALLRLPGGPLLVGERAGGTARIRLRRSAPRLAPVARHPRDGRYPDWPPTD